MKEWHSYAHGGQRSAVGGLFFLSMVFAFAWSGLQEVLDITFPWWIDTPSVLGFYGLLYASYDAWLWKKLRILHGLPDYSGEYDVQLFSSHDGMGTPTSGRIKIKQSWSKIVVRLATEGSESVSKGGYMTETPGEGYCLVYVYHNTPTGRAPDSMNQHDGTAEIRLSLDGLSGRGVYYTGRGRRSHGELHLTRKK